MMQVAFVLKRNDIIKGILLVSIVLSVFISHNRLGSFNDFFLESSNNNAATASAVTSLPRIDIPIQQQQQQQASIKATTTKYNRRRRRRKILLGIFTDMEYFPERQRRHLIRNTYLDYDRIHNNTSAPHRSCSLKEFLQQQQQRHTNYKHYYDSNDCQLIYTFVCGVIQNNYNNNNTTNNEPSTTASTTTSSHQLLTIDPSQFPKYIYETDLLFLKLDGVPPTDDDGGGETNKINHEQYNKVQMIFQWYKYTKLLFQNSNIIDKDDYIDYVAFTDTEVIIKPTEFWNNTIFFPDIGEAKNEDNNQDGDTSTTSTTSSTGIYAGRFLKKRECIKKPAGKCQSLKGGNGLMRRFVLVSQDLVSYMIQQEQSMNDGGDGLLGLLPKNDNDAPEVVVANLIYDLRTSSNKPNTNNNNNNNIQIVSLGGFKVVKATTDIVYKQHVFVGDYLEAWDKYKDNVLATTTTLSSYDPDEQTAVYPRILFGIFTMDSPTEKERRNAIRETYLRYYHDDNNNNKTNNHKTPNRICSLSEYRSELDPKQEQQRSTNGSIDNKSIKDVNNNSSSSLYCQMVYAFVMGSNPNGPKELVEDVHSHLPLTVSTPPPHLSNETDIVHLNIQENMKEGKSQTWLKYALDLANTTLPIDYIGKLDSDTLLFSHRFLNGFFQDLPHSRQKKPYNIRLYAGGYRIRPSTNDFQLGPAYMGGPIYLLSLDLADYIVGPSCNRTSVAVYSEDRSMGNFVHTHPMPIRRVRLSAGPFYIHPIKLPHDMKIRWIERTLSTSTSKIP